MSLSIFKIDRSYLLCTIQTLWGTTSLRTDGFNDWKNSHIIHGHDNNDEHRACLHKYLGRSNLSLRIDSKLKIQ